MDEELFVRYEEREEQTRQLAEEDHEESDVEEEEEADPTRVCWRNVSKDERRCKILCGFTPQEFLRLFDVVECVMEDLSGRGRRSKLTKQDKLFITLAYLKHYETMDEIKNTFSVSKSALCHMLENTILAIAPALYDYFVVHLDEALGEEADVEGQFRPEMKYLIDVTFQSIWTPTGTRSDSRSYFSEVHRMYGLKSLCMHDRKGRVVLILSSEPASVPNSRICLDNVEAVNAILAPHDHAMEEEEEEWSVLVDSEHHALEARVNIVIPYRKQGRKALTPEQLQFNEQLASERKICQLFYKQMKTKFRIMSSKYRNARDDYHNVFQLCVALTNFYIILHPL